MVADGSICRRPPWYFDVICIVFVSRCAVRDGNLITYNIYVVPN